MDEVACRFCTVCCRACCAAARSAREEFRAAGAAGAARAPGHLADAPGHLARAPAQLPLLTEEIEMTPHSSKQDSASCSRLSLAQRAVEALDKAGGDCESLVPACLNSRGVAVLDQLRRLIGELKDLVGEQEDWSRRSPDGGLLLHKVQAEASGPEEPPEWAHGDLYLATNGFRFMSLYESPSWGVAAHWKSPASTGSSQALTSKTHSYLETIEMVESEYGQYSLSRASSNVYFRLTYCAGEGRSSVLQLSLSPESVLLLNRVLLRLEIPIPTSPTAARSAVVSDVIAPVADVDVHGVEVEEPGPAAASAAGKGSRHEAPPVEGCASFVAVESELAALGGSSSLRELLSTRSCTELDLAQDCAVCSIACADLDTALFQSDAHFREACMLGVRQAVARAAGEGATPEHVKVAILARTVVLLCPDGSELDGFVGRLASIPALTATVEAAGSSTELQFSLRSPVGLRGVGRVFANFLDDDMAPIRRYLVECLQVRDLQIEPWINSTRAGADTQMRRVRFAIPIPLRVRDIPESTQACSPMVPDVARVTVVYHLSQQGGEVVLRRQFVSPDIPYADLYHALRVLRFSARGGRVVLDQSTQVDRVKALPGEWCRDGDNEVIECLIREAQEQEYAFFTQALTACLLQKQLVPIPSEPRSGVLGPTVRNFRAAVVLGSSGEAQQLRRVPLIAGLGSFTKALGRVERSGKLSEKFNDIVVKLRRSKAPRALDDDYRAWLESEAEVHRVNGFKEYVDDSAWMGNLWAAWILEFFVETFALVEAGRDTKASSHEAFNATLLHHLNFFQKAAFKAAMSSLPAREAILASLQGGAGAGPEDVASEMKAFVAYGRHVIGLCLRYNEEMDALRETKRRESRR